jgi:DNA-directed RNA polymerase subunit F
MKVIEDKLITAAETKSIIKAREKEKELGYEQKSALESLSKHCKLTPKRAEEMEAELRKIERLRDRHVVAVMDNMPQDMEDLRVLFASDVINLSEDDKKAILSVVKKFS